MNGEQDVYSQRSYGSEAIGFGSKPGVAVVDFQLGFTDPVFSLVVVVAQGKGQGADCVAVKDVEAGLTGSPAHQLALELKASLLLLQRLCEFVNTVLYFRIEDAEPIADSDDGTAADFSAR